MNLPAIGETLELYGGKITRLSELRFRVQHANGKRWQGANRTKSPEIGFIAAVNCLRRNAGLPLEVQVCAYCGERPRQHGHNYCSKTCMRERLGLSIEFQKINRMNEYEPFDMTEALLVLEVIAAQPKPEPEEAEPLLTELDKHLLHIQPLKYWKAGQQAEALIKRREGYAVLDKVLERAQRRQVLKSEKAG